MNEIMETNWNNKYIYKTKIALEITLKNPLHLQIPILSVTQTLYSCGSISVCSFFFSFKNLNNLL